ncbi:type VI secretion system Vgr family protein [Acanthopleuribacter pedis]|uniref:Type VI secretion system tip protein VgrG n=1 Tax=Acanthopleuribacter pedis TaxID=442870 RepID=A0A8J7QF26_9BACT|nr:type VI secretion system tip protein TssI/VgrG [Acanthopleuribacter pedis]MBO1317313.1 type VI secretion system tip protein VgrG [Acanthopleuribacter pedis]MBO1318620.1 type VI secretion system tip protein VgrG [Acanthopleuribacter pedis]
MSVFHKHNVDDILWRGPGEHIKVLRYGLEERLHQIGVLWVEIESRGLVPAAAFINQFAGIDVMAGKEQTTPRPINGIVTQVRQLRGGFHDTDDPTQQQYRYRLEIKPKMSLLGKTKRSRIFQHKTAQDIISEVCGAMGVPFEWRTTDSFPEREYCVQYDESDLNFVKRLLEDEGAYFFYDHFSRNIVFADAPSAHQPCQPHAVASYDEEGQVKEKDEEVVMSAEFVLNVVSGKVACHDYNYQTSSTQLNSGQTNAAPAALADLEIYDHNTLHADGGKGDRMAKIRAESHLAEMCALSTHGNTRSFATGATFTLENHFDEELNTTWLIKSLRIEGEQGDFRCWSECCPTGNVFRPRAETPRPRVHGLQTATITGPGGSEVYLDQMGRCKLQFHWDREGPGNDRSSMWVRVSNNYAGRDYGIQFIPRVGHEVLVEFLMGNPDHPVVCGRVYNDNQAAPLGPEKKYQNAIKTIKDHHIIFDDSDGKEMFDMRSQKDMQILVVNDQTRTVGNNQATMVGVNQSLAVGNNRLMTVGNNQGLNVGNNQAITVAVDQGTAVGNDKAVAVGNNHTEQIANDQVTLIGNVQNTGIGVDQITQIGVNRGLQVGVDQSEVIGNNHSEIVGNDHSVVVGNDKVETIGNIKRETIGGSKAQLIGDSKSVNIAENYSANIGKVKMVNVAKASVENVMQAKALTVAGAYMVQVGGAHNMMVGISHTEEALVMRKIMAGVMLGLKCGPAKISMNRAGVINIEGTTINIKAKAALNLEGGTVAIKAKGNVTVQGSMISLN